MTFDSLTSHPDLPSFGVVPPRKNFSLDDFKLNDGTPMRGQDSLLIPGARDFTTILNSGTRVYSYRFDEAMRDNMVAARAMRRDAFIRGLLEERILPTINRRWQIDVPDKADPDQRYVQDELTKIVDAIPDFDVYKRALLDGVWYGRAGVQQSYARSRDLNDQWGVSKWEPVHGDSVQFTFDGVPAILMDAMTAGWYAARGATRGPWGDVRSTDRGGMALVLNRPYWRDRFVIHQHIREKADFFEGELAGSVQGLGLRGLVYWQYVVRTEALTWMLAYMQSVGQMDMLIFNYPWGNDAAKKQQEANANKVIGKAAIVCPRNPAGNWPAVEQLSMNDAGLKALHDLVAEYFDRHIERLIVGQSMSAGLGGPGGLEGDGRAEFAKATKDEILVYDTNRLDAVLTRDLLKPLLRYNFKWAKFTVKFKSVLPNLEGPQKVEAGTLLIQGGISVKVDEMREAAGFSRPEEGDEIVGGMPPPMPGADPNAPPPGDGGGMPPDGMPPDYGANALPPAGPVEFPGGGPPMPFSGGGRGVRYGRGRNPTRYGGLAPHDQVSQFVNAHHAGDPNALPVLRDLFGDHGDPRGEVLSRHMGDTKYPGDTTYFHHLPASQPTGEVSTGGFDNGGLSRINFWPSRGGVHHIPLDSYNSNETTSVHVDPHVYVSWHHSQRTPEYDAHRKLPPPTYWPGGPMFRDIAPAAYFTPDEARAMADGLPPEHAEHVHGVLDQHFGARAAPADNYGMGKTPTRYGMADVRGLMRFVAANPHDLAARGALADAFQEIGHGDDESLATLRTHPGPAWVAHHPETGRVAAGRLWTMPEIRRHVNDAGHNWFDPGTMRMFGTRLGKVFHGPGGVHFTTSEDDFDRTNPREHHVRRFNPEPDEQRGRGERNLVDSPAQHGNDFIHYPNAREAQRAAAAFAAEWPEPPAPPPDPEQPPPGPAGYARTPYVNAGTIAASTRLKPGEKDALLRKRRDIVRQSTAGYRERLASAPPDEIAARIAAHLAENGPTRSGVLRTKLNVTGDALRAAMAAGEGQHFRTETRPAHPSGAGPTATWFHPVDQDGGDPEQYDAGPAPAMAAPGGGNTYIPGWGGKRKRDDAVGFIRYDADEATANALLREVAAGPEHLQPGSSARLVAADAQDELGNVHHAAQLRSDLPMAGYQHNYGQNLWVKHPTGTHHMLGTHPDVAAALDRAQRSGERVHVVLGDPKTGRDWLEEHDVVGRVGQSMPDRHGPMPGVSYPVLFGSGQSGSSISGPNVVRIRGANGRDLYRHPDYSHGEVHLVDSPDPSRGADDHPHWVMVDGQKHAGFRTPLARKRYLNKLGLTVSPTQNARPAAPTPYGDRPHKYGCAMVELAGEAAIRLRGMARLVPDDLLADDGREDTPHVTVLYGLHENTADGVRRIVQATGPIKLKLGNVTVFPGGDGKDFDVVKVDVDSADLRRLNYRLKALPHTETHPQYNPHATICYVKKGQGPRVAAMFRPLNLAATVDEIVFSDAAGGKAVVPTAGPVPYRRPTPYVRSDRDGLLQAIREAPPGEHTPRLVAADWYDENGDPETAARLRDTNWLVGVTADGRVGPGEARQLPEFGRGYLANALQAVPDPESPEGHSITRRMGVHRLIDPNTIAEIYHDMGDFLGATQPETKKGNRHLDGILGARFYGARNNRARSAFSGRLHQSTAEAMGPHTLQLESDGVIRAAQKRTPPPAPPETPGHHPEPPDDPNDQYAPADYRRTRG